MVYRDLGPENSRLYALTHQQEIELARMRRWTRIWLGVSIASWVLFWIALRVR
jgi:hypothetical protein